MSLDALTSCAELTNEHAEHAVRSAESFRAFIAWAAAVARPGDGAPKVLMAIARLIGKSWVEGTPKVEIRAEQTTTTLSVFAEHGAGIRERIVPIARLHVPFAELTQAIRLAPQLILPFEATEATDVIFLSPPGPAKADEVEAIRIDGRSLHEQERETVVTLADPSSPNAPPEPPTVPDASGPHTHPTVRQMIAVRPEVLRSGSNLDPLDLEDDD